MLAGVTACACVLLLLRAWRLLSHITVCGNGAHSGKGIVHYHQDNLLQAKLPCLCALPWGEEETLCCLISMHNRQYENPAGSSAGASGLVRRDVQGRSERYIRIHLQDFVPLHLRLLFSWLQCQVATTVLPFDNLLCDVIKNAL